MFYQIVYRNQRFVFVLFDSGAQPISMYVVDLKRLTAKRIWKNPSVTYDKDREKTEYNSIVSLVRRLISKRRVY